MLNITVNLQARRAIRVQGMSPSWHTVLV
jgi:hypothetical protein